MHVDLAIPENWTSRREPDRGLVVGVVDDSGDVEIEISVGPLMPWPDHAEAWRERVLRQSLPANSELEVTRVTDRTTDNGWRMWLLDARVSAADGSHVEHRLAAYYRFLEYGAAALVRSHVAARHTQYHDGIVSVLATARPNFDGSLAAVSDLWAGFDL